MIYRPALMAEAEAESTMLDTSETVVLEGKGEDAMATDGPTVAGAEDDGAKRKRDQDGDGDGKTAGEDTAQGEDEAAGGESEVLWIMIYGIRQWDTQKQVSKWLSNNGVKFDKVRRIPKTNAASVRFTTVAERDAGMEKVRNALYKGQTLFTKVSREDPGAHIRRQHKDGEGGGGRGEGEPGSKRAKAEEGGQQQPKKKKTLLEVVIPLHKVPYEQQLKQKQGEIRSQCVEKLFREIKHAYRQRIKQRQQSGEGGFVEMYDWVKQGASTMQLHDIRPAPQTEAYRNKCEFTIGRDEAGAATVGFRMSGFEQGVTVQSPEQCSHVDDQTKAVAAAFQRYIRASSLPVYDVVANTGVWRLLTVRTSSRTKQCMVIVCVSVGKLEAGVWAAEEQRLKAWLSAATEPTITAETGVQTSDMDVQQQADDKAAAAAAGGEAEAEEEGVGSWLGVTSLFLQPFEGKSAPSMANDPVRRLWGRAYLEEDLLGLRFRISPTAFFQTSTTAAEVLYSVVADWCDLSNTTTTTAALEADSKAGEQDAAAEGTGNQEEEGNAEADGREPAAAEEADSKAEGEAGGRGPEEEKAGEKGAEEAGAKEGGEGRGPVLLDVCCGTGTIGICCAAKSRASSVVGIEMVEGAVEDALVNAKANNIQNAAFVCCKAEDVLLNGLTPGWFVPSEPDPANVTEVLQHAVHHKVPVLAVVDPPRDGLHGDCIRAIRNCEGISRLIYVSCNPTGSLVRDGVALCSAPSKRLTGPAFRPVHAVPVDMFPHTHHCECVMIFER